jgi:hypothetical protein
LPVAEKNSLLRATGIRSCPPVSCGVREELMVKTYGLTHINLAVQDLDRALGFYKKFAPGFSCAYVSDPDGYEVEIWYE